MSGSAVAMWVLFGPALVGNIGSESFFKFSAIGDTKNLAARLSAEARK